MEFYRSFYRLLLLLLCIILMPGCKNSEGKRKVDLAEEEKALFLSHVKDRQAHFDRDAEALLVNSVDSFIYVRDGKVSTSLKADRIKGMSNVLKDAEYIKWDNMESPVIRISDDGSMAWVITRLEVERMKKDSTGKQNRERFVYAGIMTYKKLEDQWVKEANVSTFE